MLRTAVVLILGFAGAAPQQTTDPATEAARMQDIYAVYSAAIASSSVIGGDTNKQYAIAFRTTPAMLGRSFFQDAPDPVKERFSACDAPPPGYEDRWQEVLADSRSRGDAPAPLVRGLQLTKPYVYLSAEEQSVFFSTHTINARPVPNPQFGGAVSVISLSNVFFDKDRKLAVMRFWSSCGMLCGSGERKIFEKTPTGWKEVVGGTRCIMSA